MMDLCDQWDTEKNDILFQETSRYKIRNLLSLTQGENPLYPEMGIDPDILMTPQSLEVIKIRLSHYLYSYFCFISSLQIQSQDHGTLLFEIKSPNMNLIINHFKTEGPHE